MKMNPGIKDLWLEALRGGQYEQGHGRLRVGDNHCCLGVLCDLHSFETGDKWEKIEADRWRYLGASNVIPVEVQEWAGLVSEGGTAGYNPYVGDEDNYNELAVHNDGREQSNGPYVPPKNFDEIADLIEEWL